MKLGSTSVSTEMAASVASEALTPCWPKLCSWWRVPPTSRHSPTMPLRISITAANTVSRASAPVSKPPASISETISATSITVTASARISVPKGSPTRCATTSAWCTAASTLPIRPAASKSGYQRPAPTNVPARISQPATGAARVQGGMKPDLFMG